MHRIWLEKNHPADTEMQKGSQRLLDCMPAVVYLKIEKKKADWVIHTRLPPGVWPLWVVKRQWVINNKTGPLVVRRGFPLVPDYASTAFMMQGETLKAEIAECGDIFTEPRMDVVLTTYVIL